jgi:DNA-binding FadR family transcriptional regulator
MTSYESLPRLRRPLHACQEEIAKRIVLGVYPPGSRLPSESELCRLLGVSRTVLREAMKSLSTLGLVKIMQGRATRVAPPESWNHLAPLIMRVRTEGPELKRALRELLEVRSMVEVEVAGLAAQRAEPEHLEQLRKLLQQMGWAFEDPVEYTRLDNEFHLGIVRAAGNYMLLGLFYSLIPMLTVGKEITCRQRPSAIAESNEGHHRIYVAIADADPAGAREAMRAHLAQFEDDLRIAFENHLGAVRHR